MHLTFGIMITIKCSRYKTISNIRRKPRDWQRLPTIYSFKLVSDYKLFLYLFLSKSGENMIEIDNKQYFGVIYKIENTITHCVYIGQTTHPKGFNGRYYYKGKGIERVYNYLKCKKKCGERYNKHLLCSIEKCGLEAFIVEEVYDTADTMQELNDKEIYYIKKFDSFNNGYNMSYGGDSIGGIKRPKGKDCPNSKQIYQIGLDGNIIKLWNSATEASNCLHIDATSILWFVVGKEKLLVDLFGC